MEALIAMFLILGAAFPLCAWMSKRDADEIERESREWRENYSREMREWREEFDRTKFVPPA